MKWVIEGLRNLALSEAQNELSLEKWKAIIDQKEKIDRAIKRIFETLTTCIDNPDLVRSKEVIKTVDEAIVDIQSGLGFLFGFVRSDREKMWMGKIMESVTHFHTRIFSLYAHFYRTLEKDQIETLLKWARIVLPKISNVSIEPETLEVSVPEMKRLKITKGISDYASEIIVGIISAVVASILTTIILKIFL